MENKSFFVQYGQNQPIQINSHINDERTALRVFPLQNVGDLVTAFKFAVVPLLNQTSISHLTLHATADAPALPKNMLLSSIDESVGTYERPLIVLLHDTVTIDEYMVWPLPVPVYENEVATGNSSGSAWSCPTHVFLWSDFQQCVTSWIAANHERHGQRIERPVFVPRVITEEVQSLQPFILDNLLNVSAKCFIPTSEFKARRQITSCVGEPDHLLTRNGEILAIVEEKGKWTLTTDDHDLVNSYYTRTHCASALNQLYHYMRLNHRKYGILSSYEHTWFVYRSKECDICEQPQGHEALYVSQGISFAAQNPTAQQSFSFFNSIVDNLHMDSPPTSKCPPRAASATTSRAHSLNVSPRASLSRGGSPLSSEIQINEQAQDFDVDDFKFDAVLGEGRSKVYLDNYGSSRIALKVADIAKHEEMLRELLNEVSVYEQLSMLQGNGIPKFFCHGYVEDVLYCVGVSICGVVAHEYTEEQKRKLLETLNCIHEAGILHNDIKKENILIDESGKPFIIDFGFATRNCSPAAQREEKDLLLLLLEST